jgi:hypothetical protein
MAQQCGFPRMNFVGTSFAIYLSKASFPDLRRTTMKFETLMLQGLFAICLLVCVLTFGAMLVTSSASTNAVANHAPVAASSHSAA